MAGNCKSKERFIDGILQLEEDVQAVLMEVMMKFIPKEEPLPGSVEQELVESLNGQLKQKEVERLGLMEHLKKVETENAELARRMQELQTAYRDACAESQRDKQEFDSYRNKYSSVELGHAKLQQETEFEEEIESLNREVEELRQAMSDLEKSKDEEIAKLSEDLAAEQQKHQRLTAAENTIDQQKRKIDELCAAQQSMMEDLKRGETLQMRVAVMENDRKHFDEKNKELVESLYTEKNETRRLDGELKKLTNSYSRMEKEKKASDELCKFWEQKAKTTDESSRKERESRKQSADGAGLLLEEREATHQLEIAKLQEEVRNLLATGGEAAKTYTFELEAQAKSLRTENEKLGQDLAVSAKLRAQFELENDQLKSRNEVLAKENEDGIERAKELMRIRQERDMLLEGYRRAQDTLPELTELKQKVGKVQKENEQLKKEMETCRKEWAEMEAKYRPLSESNLRLEKDLARAQQKITLIEEERGKLDALVKTNAKKYEAVSLSV